MPMALTSTTTERPIAAADQPAFVDVEHQHEQGPGLDRSTQLSGRGAPTGGLASRLCCVRRSALAFAMAALGASMASGTISYACVRDEETRNEWSQNTWTMVVHSPHAAFVTLCIAQRKRLRSIYRLHKWTRVYGIVAGVLAVWAILQAPNTPCLDNRWRDNVEYALQGILLVAIVAVKLIPAVLLQLKLQDLGSWWAARAVVVCMLAWTSLGAASMSVFFAYDVLGLSEVERDQTVLWLGLAFVLAYLAVVLSGLWGLLTSSVRAAQSGKPEHRQAARWVALTAASLLASWLSTAAVGLLLLRGVSHSYYFAAFADGLLDCASVALFGGLVGPPQLRRLSTEAFEQINSFSEQRRQALYEEFLNYLDMARIKWVKCGYLRRLARQGATMVRCQNVPPTDAVLGNEGFPHSRGDTKGRYVLSHPWLSKAHPDPDGLKLQALVHQLDVLKADDEDAVFIDYMGLPQHDSQDPDLQRLERENKWPKPGEHRAVRTEEEEAQFKTALGSMELLYSLGSTPVIVLPMGGYVEQDKEYISRGWCFLEFCLALSFDNIANTELHTPVRRLYDAAIFSKAHTMRGFRRSFKDTHFTCSGDKNVVLELFERTLKRRNT